jgi:hypothetical protein
MSQHRERARVSCFGSYRNGAAGIIILYAEAINVAPLNQLPGQWAAGLTFSAVALDSAHGVEADLGRLQKPHRQECLCYLNNGPKIF